MACAERCALVRAFVVERVETGVQPDETKLASPGRDAAALAGGEAVFGSGAQPQRV